MCCRPEEVGMKLSYGARKRLKHIFITLSILLLVAVTAFGCWLLWLGKFVVYTRDEGAVLDFTMPPLGEKGELIGHDTAPTVSIYFNEGDNAINTSTELFQLSGYYIEPKALQKDVAGVKAQIQSLEPDVPILINLKTIYGGFLYQSEVSAARSDTVDIAAVQELITYLTESNHYTIAMMPALRDRDHGLNHTNDGLPDAAYKGGALWADDQGCYWLNPTSQGTLSLLVKIATEIKGLGFDEIVFSEFRIPEHERIMFQGERPEALAATAKTLVSTCSTNTFAVSFVGDGSWKAPEGRSRLYVEGTEPAQAENQAESLGLKDPKINLVFMTELYDTRFDVYGTLRPLSAAH